MEGKFISLRITVSQDAYKQLRADYNVIGTPTVLFLKPDGGEIDRLVGFGGDKDEYFQTVQDYAAGKNTLSSLLDKYKANPLEIEINYTLAKKYVDRFEMDEAPPYFAKVLELDPKDNRGYKTEATYYMALNELRNNKNPEPIISFIATHKEEKYIAEAFPNLAVYYVRAKENDKALETYLEAVEKLPNNVGMIHGYAGYVFRTKIEDEYAKALKLTHQAIEMEPERATSGYMNLVTHYKNIKDTDNLMSTYDLVLEANPDVTYFMNAYAWDIHLSKVKDRYDTGIMWAKKALEKEPETGRFWATLGNLYYDKGDQKNAVAAMSKAVEFSTERTIANYKRILEKFKEGR